MDKGESESSFLKYIEELSAKHREERKQEPEEGDLGEEVESVEYAPLTAEKLERILLDEEFGGRVVEAIQKTEDFLREPTADLSLPLKLRPPSNIREHGFIVYTPYGNSFEVSPLFQGEEHRINLHEQFTDHILEIEPGVGEVLEFHSHPAYTGNAFGESGIFGQAVDDRFRRKRLTSRVFSASDLTAFRKLSYYPSLVIAIGASEADRKYGRLILLSAHFLSRARNIDVRQVERDTLANLDSNPSGNRNPSPSGIYRAAGLNYADLRVNFSGPPYLDPKAVASASKILTSKAAK